jgi:hypothetical protein
MTPGGGTLQFKGNSNNLCDFSVFAVVEKERYKLK